jgi:glycosyltransferase involved in cell wall biosynthesis
MKEILFRYLGKILTLIKKEGISATVKKVFTAIWAVLRPIGSGEILFISSGVVGNSWRFRVKNVAEELGFHGFKCRFVVQEHPFLASAADNFSVFIFHQASHTPQVKKLIEKIKAQEKEIIFETDDLLFDPAFVKKQDFFVNSNALMKKFYENNVGSEFVNDPYIKTCTTTTSFLAQKLREHGKEVFVVPNKLSANDLNIIKKISKNNRYGRQSSIRFGYFSGEMSHNRDFATITEALLEIMEKFPLVELFLAGPLSLENKLNKYAGRIKQLPYVGRKKHFENIAKIDINLAPLEANNPFCEAKSELKFFEAGILSVPTVASATQTFREAISDGEDGFVAATKEEWVEKMSRLIENDGLRKEMGEKARVKCLEKYTNQNSKNEAYYEYLRNKLNT